MYIYAIFFCEFSFIIWPKTLHVLIVIYNYKTQETAEPFWKLGQQWRSLKLIKFPSAYWKCKVSAVRDLFALHVFASYSECS